MDLKSIKVEIEIESSICRTCLTPNATTSLHEDCDCDDGSTLGAMLEKIAEVCVEEYLPSVICSVCAGDLRSAIAFRRRAQLADQTLRQKGSTNPNFDNDHTVLLPSMDFKFSRDFIDENNSDIDLSLEEDSLLKLHKRKNKKAPVKKLLTIDYKANEKTQVTTMFGCSQSLQREKITDKQTATSNCSPFSAGKSRYDKTVNTNVTAMSKFDKIYQTTKAAFFVSDCETNANDTSMMETQQSSTTNDSMDNFNLEKYVPFNEVSFEQTVTYNCFESWSPPGSPRRVPSPPRRAPEPPLKAPVETVEIVDTSVVKKSPPVKTSIDTTQEEAAEIDWYLPVIENIQTLQHSGENKSAQVYNVEETEGTKEIFLCNVCKKVLNSNLALDDHIMRKHHNKCPYPECGGIFKTRILLRRHIKACHLDRLFVCLTCGEKFASKSLVAKHMISHKPKTEKEKTIQCQICKVFFVCSNELSLHTRQKHPGEKPYKCSKCDKRFVDNTTLKNHQEEEQHFPGESNLKPCFFCTVCSKRCENSSLLIHHMLYVHSKERKFYCKRCGRKFDLESKLVLHEKCVHGLHNKRRQKKYMDEQLCERSAGTD